MSHATDHRHSLEKIILLTPAHTIIGIVMPNDQLRSIKKISGMDRNSNLWLKSHTINFNLSNLSCTVADGKMMQVIIKVDSLAIYVVKL